MKAGRPKGPNDRPARSTHGRGQAADRTLGARNRSRDNRQPRQTSKCSLSRAMRDLPPLSAEDWAEIEAVAAQPFGAREVAQCIASQLIFANRCLETGTISAKDYVVALNKIGSQIAAAVQLRAKGGSEGPSVRITWADDDDD